MPIRDPEKRRAYAKQYRQEHKEYFRKQTAALRKRHRDEGRCNCGKDKESGHKFCPDCQDATTRRSQAKRAKRKAEGKCSRCGIGSAPVCERCKNVYKRYAAKRRQTVLDHYGNVCACCGESEPIFLSIDHIHNDGFVHRKSVSNIYTWLIRQDFPEGFQILCHNCNLGKHINGGICPHQFNT